jgi:hypothetical protein
MLATLPARKPEEVSESEVNYNHFISYYPYERAKLGTGVPVRKPPTPVPSEHNPSSITMFGDWEPIKIPTPVKYFLIGAGFTLIVFAVYFLQNSV